MGDCVVGCVEIFVEEYFELVGEFFVLDMCLCVWWLLEWGVCV